MREILAHSDVLAPGGIIKSATSLTWAVDGVLIATVDPATAVGTENIYLGHSDAYVTSSTDPNDADLLFTLIDNVELIPEPESLALLALAPAGLLIRRRPRPIRG